MDDRRYEELARRLADYPGRWIPWPVPFGTRAEADRLFESLRDGGCEAFRVDSAAFRWRMDEFTMTQDVHPAYRGVDAAIGACGTSAS